MNFEYFIYYLVLINLTGFLSILSDKMKAHFGWKRLAAKKFFFISVVGGGAGILIGTYLFNHLNDEDYAYFKQFLIKSCFGWAIFILLVYAYNLLK